MQSAIGNEALHTEGAAASSVTLGTEEMDKTLSQPMNRWMCSPVACCVQVIGGQGSCGRSSCPPPTGSKTAAEGEVDLTAFVFSPCSKRHYDNRAVVFGAELYCLREETSCQHHHLSCLENETSIWLHMRQYALRPKTSLHLLSPDTADSGMPQSCTQDILPSRTLVQNWPFLSMLMTYSARE